MIKWMGAPATLRRVENEFWDLVCRGVTQVEAAELVGAGTTTAQQWLKSTGGIRPRLVLVIGVDPSRRARCLTEFEREHIRLRLAQAVGVRQISRELGRAPSTITVRTPTLCRKSASRPHG